MQATFQAKKICAALKTQIDSEPGFAIVHSVFSSAVNLVSAYGMVTLLRADRVMQPYTLLLRQDTMPNWKTGATVYVSAEGICGRQGSSRVDFDGASPEDLRIPHTVCSPAQLRAAASMLDAYLRRHVLSQGLVSLIDSPVNSFVRYLTPHINTLRAAVCARDLKTALRETDVIAGCGVGLTPSSDDWLMGYATVLCACARMQPDFVRRLCRQAAENTGEISAHMLRRVGDGLTSSAMLDFLAHINADNGPILPSIDTIAAFGQTSGLDMLTGVCLALEDAATLVS